VNQIQRSAGAPSGRLTAGSNVGKQIRENLVVFPGNKRQCRCIMTLSIRKSTPLPLTASARPRAGAVSFSYLATPGQSEAIRPERCDGWDSPESSTAIVAARDRPKPRPGRSTSDGGHWQGSSFKSKDRRSAGAPSGTVALARSGTSGKFDARGGELGHLRPGAPMPNINAEKVAGGKRPALQLRKLTP
jgi:hypothetical protein